MSTGVRTTGGDGATRTQSIANYRNVNVADGGQPGISFARVGTPTSYAYFKMKLLETTHPSSILPRFFNRYTLPQNQGDTMTFWRMKEMEPVDTPVPEGMYPAPNTIDYDELQVKPRRYTGWAEVTRDASEMAVMPVEEHTIKALGKQCLESTENICWRVMVNGTHVRYAGDATNRGGVGDEMTATDVYAVCRDLIRREAQVISDDTMTGNGSLWATPQLETYAGFGHSDLEGTLLELQKSPQNARVGRDFTARVAYGSGAGGDKAVAKYEIGQLHRIRFYLHVRLYPFADAGRNASAIQGNAADRGFTHLVSTGGTHVDVYPVPIIGANALGLVGLEGYRGGEQAVTPHANFDAKPRKGLPSGKILINPIRSRDSGDPGGRVGSFLWEDYFSPFIENDNWMSCIETGVRAY